MAIRKISRMALFLIIVFTVYFLSNLYIYIKGATALKGTGYETLYTILFTGLASTFILGKFLEYRFTNVFTDILNITGGFWMAFMLYAFLLWLAADVFHLLNSIFHFLPPLLLPEIRLWSFISITSLTILLIIIGFVNAVTPVVRHYSVSTEKSFDDGEKGMVIVAVSDIHLGSIIRKRSMRHLSEMIKAENPDVVLFLGDIIDGSIAPVLRGDLLSYLTLPDLKYGHYAITGNHEYIGNINRSVPYLESKGMRVLLDEVITLGNGVQIAGRLDRSAGQGMTRGRASLDSLLSPADTTRPVILLDHQPFDLDMLDGHNVDLQLSGHTHDGQMWPLNIITRRMYKISHGEGLQGKTRVIVSSGFGIWGPRVRLGTRPEIVVINFKNHSE